MPIYISDPNQAIIYALVFILGLVIGAFMTAGGRRKWKTRYKDEVTRREAIEREQREREKHFEAREKEWREQDSMRAAAIKDRDRDGVRDDRQI